jgi:hypothetical protein
LICAASAVVAVAAEPRYRLINGKGYSVCEAFLKNLNAFPASEPPMVCDVKVHPTHSEFSLPDWKAMDIQRNLKIVYAAESQMPTLNGRSGIPPLPYDEWVKAFQERIRTGKATPLLRRAVLTLNSRGPETVIAYRPVTSACVSAVALYNGAAPDDYMFVLRTGSEPLVERVNLMNTSLVMFKKRPYFFTSGSQDLKTWGIDLRYVSPVLPALSGTSQYVPLFRCEFRVSK